jgi:hypothetical protein
MNWRVRAIINLYKEINSMLWVHNQIFWNKVDEWNLIKFHLCDSLK